MAGAVTENGVDLQERIRELEMENRRLKRFCRIGKTICVERDLQKLIPLIMSEISKALNADRSSLFLIDWDRMELWSSFAEGLKSEKICIKLKMGLVGMCVFTKRLVNAPDARSDPRFNPEIDEMSGFRTESVLGAPLFDGNGEVMGVIELLNKKTGIFTKEDERNTETTANSFKIDGAEGLSKEKARLLIRELRRWIDFERGSVFLVDREKGALTSLYAEGFGDKNIHLTLNLGIAGLAAMTDRDINMEDAYRDSRFDKSEDERSGYRTRCILCVPLKGQAGDVMGVIEVINKIDGPFTDSDMENLKTLSSFVAISIENSTLLHEQQRQFESILEVLAASIDAKDSLTAGHSKNVSGYAIGIARELGFEESEIDSLRAAAWLHDYGKLGVDDSVLKKPGKLSHDEYKHIKQHVVNTRNILSKIYFSRKYRSVPMIASCHHERLDGKGYMDGLRGHEIPFMSKIITVADVFEALTADRHYRKALSPDAALRELEKGVGSAFEESIVTALGNYLASR